MSDIQMARRCLTTRRVILLGLFIAVCRLTWQTLYSLFQSEHERFSVGFSETIDLDPNLPPKGCIMTANKTCIPENPDDVYLGKGLYAHGDSFYLDGRPFRIFGGSFHYFRTQPADWGDRLMKMKAAGLNTVTTYIPWNLHEPIKDQYQFGGRWDLASFIKQAQQVGLKVIIRPGPYICAEWEFGGLPAWLLKDPEMKVRTSNKRFLLYVEEYFTKLFSILLPLTYKNGGPIIAFQVENEYGSYGTDKEYLNFVLAQIKKFGIEELLFTSDGTEPEQLGNGTIPGVLATANFKENPERHLEELKEFQPNKPLMVTEFWPGWFDHWSEDHNGMKNAVFEQTVTAIFEFGASINFYMFVGGTNFEFWNGANMAKTGDKYEPTITSYDYDAPISEDGSLKEKFFITQRLIAKYSANLEEPVKITDEVQRVDYNRGKIDKWLSYRAISDIAQEAIHAKNGGEIVREHPLSMEYLDIVNGCGQNNGFILYRTEIHSDQPHHVDIYGDIRDRAQMLLNDEEITVFYRNDGYPTTTLPVRPALEHGYSNLDFLVENMGRVNYKSLDNEHKGIIGTVKVDNQYVTSWKHIPLDFDEEFMDIIAQQDNWQHYTTLSEQEKLDLKIRGPAMFKTYLNLDALPKDTYIDMYGWTKGVVFVNGYNIGRYWRVGPQRTMYLPGSLLIQGRNVIIVFELHKPYDSIAFTHVPLLDHRW